METTDSTPNPESAERKFQPWGDVTDPGKHNSNKFRYLIYGINPAATVLIGAQAHTLVRGDDQTRQTQGGDQSINLFNHPEDLDKRISLSCSLIDQDHHGTWGKAGLIVESPPENVCITSPSDIGASGLSKTLLTDMARRNPVLTAERLFDQTDPNSYNEVVALASNGEKRVQLTGFFYKVTDEQEPMDESLAQRMKAHAERLHLPIVAISEPNPYAANKIIRGDNKLSVQFNGKLYWLRYSNDRYRFRGTDQRNIFEFIDPQTITNVLRYLQENGVDDLEIEELREEYFLADKERQKPKVKFDEQGEVNGIEKKSGYGKTEKIMRVSKIGSAHWSYVSEARKQISDMYASRGMNYVGEMPTLKLSSPQEVESIVQEALTAVTDEERTRIEAWYESIKENVAKYSPQHKEQLMKWFKGTKPKLDFDFTKLLKEFPKDKDQV